MSVYRLFRRSDVMTTVIRATPEIELASGTLGWSSRVFTETASGSVSLYGGIRSRLTTGISIQPEDPIDTHSIDKTIFVTGSYPSTGSVSYAKLRTSAAPSSTYITHEDWYDEHLAPILNLYDFYSRRNPEYHTGSYDYYSLFFSSPVATSSCAVIHTSNTLATVSSSFTLSSFVKPIIISGSDNVILSQYGKFKLYITGTTSRIAFSDYASTITSSVPLSIARWSHVAISVGTNSASFYINGVLDSTVAYTGTLLTKTSSFMIGSEIGLDGVSSQKYINGFDGYIFESRVYSRKLSSAQISSSWNSTIIKSSSDSTLVNYTRFNDGPRGIRHGLTIGSGAFDHSLTANHGTFVGFNQNLPLSPLWQPNDCVDFYPRKVRLDSDAGLFKVVHLPSLFYGRSIVTGSVRLVCNSYLNKGIQRILVDDGRGSLYLSGSSTRALSGETYAGVAFNKVGNVFYDQGIMLLTDPSMLDFGESNLDPYYNVGTTSYAGNLDGPFEWIFEDAAILTVNANRDMMWISYKGETRTPSKVFMCHAGAGEANSSNNPTFSAINEFTEKPVPVRNDRTTYITTVNIYDERRRLVAVAKLAQPIRKREKDRLNIRLKFDM